MIAHNLKQLLEDILEKWIRVIKLISLLNEHWTGSLQKVKKNYFHKFTSNNKLYQYI